MIANNTRANAQQRSMAALIPNGQRVASQKRNSSTKTNTSAKSSNSGGAQA